MSIRNRVFTANYALTIAAGATLTSNFSIQSVGREIQIRSITVDWQIMNTLTGAIIPWRSVTDQLLNLIIGNFGLTPIQIGSAFLQTGGTGPAFNGNTFRITEPRQILFNSFFIANELPLSLQVNNLAAAERDHNISVIIETSEKTLFL